jgi:hypothetical protein
LRRASLSCCEPSNHWLTFRIPWSASCPHSIERASRIPLQINLKQLNCMKRHGLMAWPVDGQDSTWPKCGTTMQIWAVDIRLAVVEGVNSEVVLRRMIWFPGTNPSGRVCRRCGRRRPCP